VPDKPPFVAIEVLSPDDCLRADRLSDVRNKLAHDQTWGVPNVWFVDPHSQRFYVCDPAFREIESLTIPEMSIALTKEQLFGNR
jgi:Uma2 family endonuclease